MYESSDERYVMEVAGQSVGLLVSDHSRYTFYAANKAAQSLDWRDFASPEAAQRAVEAVVRPKLERKAGALTNP